MSTQHSVCHFHIVGSIADTLWDISIILSMKNETSEFCWLQTFTSVFESYWVPYLFRLVLHLHKKKSLEITILSITILFIPDRRPLLSSYISIIIFKDIVTHASFSSTKYIYLVSILLLRRQNWSNGYRSKKWNWRWVQILED